MANTGSKPGGNSSSLGTIGGQLIYISQVSSSFSVIGVMLTCGQLYDLNVDLKTKITGCNGPLRVPVAPVVGLAQDADRGISDQREVASIPLVCNT